MFHANRESISKMFSRTKRYRINSLQRLSLLGFSQKSHAITPCQRNDHSGATWRIQTAEHSPNGISKSLQENKKSRPEACLFHMRMSEAHPTVMVRPLF